MRRNKLRNYHPKLYISSFDRRHDREESMQMPCITLLTPCLNGARHITEAIESVRQQNYPNLEHIVLDACSTDGTLELLANYPHLTVVSEPDDSSHHALNKGISRASGDIIGILNSDDLCPDGALQAVATSFSEDASIDVVVGHAVVFEDVVSGSRRVLNTYTHQKDGGLWLPELTFGVHGVCCCYFRRSALSADCTFREEYNFTADRRFLISLKLAGANSVCLDRPVIWYRCHSGSATINPQKRNLTAISKEYFLMAAELARLTSDRPELQRTFRAWHALEGVKLLLRNLGNGAFEDAFEMMLTLIRADPNLPFRLVQGLNLRHTVRKSMAKSV
jgi:glycosyltransferase involved in cell wall biosynthesis